MDDFYELLGVGRQADEAELRRAYRKLAKEHHPDLNGGNPEAAARFKTINEAYEVLRDPRKRALYDRYGAAAFQNGGGRAGEAPMGDLGDLFEQLFNFGGRRGGRGRDAAEQGESLQIRLRLDFREAVFGVTRELEIQRRESCDSCHGSGAAANSAPVTCKTCQGQGEVRQVQQSILGQFVNVQTCPTCRGRGQTIADPCPSCRGQGLVSRTKTLELDVPAGIEDGNGLRLTGEGSHGRFGGPPGDLLVGLQVKPDPVFERQGNDVHMTLQLNAADAALGVELEVPTLDGTHRLRIPAGTQTGDRFTVDSQGVPYLRRGGRGKLVVTSFVSTPEKLSREQQQLYEQLRAGLAASAVVDRGASGSGSKIWQRIKDLFA